MLHAINMFTRTEIYMIYGVSGRPRKALIEKSAGGENPWWTKALVENTPGNFFITTTFRVSIDLPV